MGVPIFGGNYVDSGSRGNGGINILPTEYYHPVYCDSYDTVDIYGDRTADGTMGETTMLEAGGCIPITGGSDVDGKGNRGFYVGWCGYGGREAKGRCGIVDKMDN